MTPHSRHSITRHSPAGPHYNTALFCRPSLQHKAPLRPSLQHKAPLQALTTTRHPIAGPYYNTKPKAPFKPSLQHDAPLQALITTQSPISGHHYNTTPHFRPLLQHKAQSPIASPHYNTTPHCRPWLQYVGKHEPSATVSSSRPHTSSRKRCGPLSYLRGRPPEWTMPLNDQAVTDFSSPVVGRSRGDSTVLKHLNVASTEGPWRRPRYTACAAPLCF